MITTTQRLWVSDNGDVTCDNHAGVYLSSAIKNHSKARVHRTPLGTFASYTIEDIGLPCSSCVDWKTLDLGE